MLAIERLFQRPEIVQVAFHRIEMLAHFRILFFLKLPKAARITKCCRHPSALQDVGKTCESDTHFTQLRHHAIDRLALNADNSGARVDGMPPAIAVGSADFSGSRDKSAMPRRQTCSGSSAVISDCIQCNSCSEENQKLEIAGSVVIDGATGDGLDRR